MIWHIRKAELIYSTKNPYFRLGLGPEPDQHFRSLMKVTGIHISEPFSAAFPEVGFGELNTGSSCSNGHLNC